MNVLAGNKKSVVKKIWEQKNNKKHFSIAFTSKSKYFTPLTKTLKPIKVHKPNNDSLISFSGSQNKLGAMN